MYVLIDCGLIHKYLATKEDIKKIEDETFYTVEVIKDLSGYEVKNEGDKLTLSNRSETLAFNRTSNNDKYFKYYLDEYKSF